MHRPKIETCIDVFMIGISNAAAFSLPQRERLRRCLEGHRFHLHESDDEGLTGGHALIVRADWVIEKRLLQALLKSSNTLLKQDDAGKHTYFAAFVPAEKFNGAMKLIAQQPLQMPTSLIGSKIARPSEICGSFESELRKSETPVSAELSIQTRDQVERALFLSSYKGATDFITKYLWPVPALFAVRALAQRGISPNAITLLSMLCVLVTFFLFWNGWFWWGLGTAYLMAFLDTVDGKLARVTLTSSQWGHLLDHGIDLLSPPFWWGAWFAGLIGTSYENTEAFQNLGWPALWVMMGFYWLVRVVEASFVRIFGFSIHIWRRTDFVFRLITTRRNVNVSILGAGLLFGRPDLGFIGMSLWSILSFAYHMLRFCQAWFRRKDGDTVKSFLNS
jgi:phosphatidylglycerophosphate synthase